MAVSYGVGIPVLTDRADERPAAAENASVTPASEIVCALRTPGKAYHTFDEDVAVLGRVVLRAVIPHSGFN